MASSGGDGGGGDRRVPHNLQGVLKFCMENTATEDAPGSSSYQEMDPERRAFLEEVLNKLSGNDPMKQILAHLQLLHQDAEGVEEAKCDALEDIQSWCENIDNAQDFHKMGGYSLLPNLLQDSSADVQWRTAELIATIVQNNPYCQKAALEENLLPILLDLLDRSEEEQVRIKSLFAVSCLCRDSEEAQKVFVDSDGFSVMIRAMQSETEKLQLKAAFMLTAMMVTQPAFKDTLCNLGMIEQLISLLLQEHASSHEHFMNALLTLVKGNDKRTEECRRPELHFKKFLEERISYLKGKEEYQEELDYSQQLRQICFSAGSSLDR